MTTATSKGRRLSSTNPGSGGGGSSGSSDSSSSQHLRPRRRASLLEELAHPSATELQRGGSYRPSKASSSDHHRSSSWEHQSHSPFNNSLPANFGTAEEEPDYYNTTTHEIRVHKPSWGKNNTIHKSFNHGTTAAGPARPKLLKSVSMRSSFIIGRRCSAGEATDIRNNQNGHLRQDSFRRLSLQTTADNHHHAAAAHSELLPDASVSDYQEVFQQMKLQNPTASLGALQQKTMKRMSELKVEKEEMEKMNMERLRELENLHHHHHGNNTNNGGGGGGGGGRMTLLGSLFSHNNASGRGMTLLHRPRAGSDLDGGSSGIGSDRSSDRDNNNHNNNNSTHTPKAPYDVDDSFRSENSIDDETPSHRPNVLSRATVLISRRTSYQDSATSGDYQSRRSTIDSNPLSEADTSTENNFGGGAVGVGVVPIVQSPQLMLRGEDQKGNFAPRKSVGDFTAMMAGYNQNSDDDDNHAMGSDDDNRSGPKSLCSEMSGLYISGDESIGIGSYANCENKQQHQDDEQLEILETHFQRLGDTSQRSNSYYCDTSHRHSVLSADSNHTTATEGSYNGSLIVGFGKRDSETQPTSLMKKQRPEDEDESRGFAADFSAWDNR